MLFKLLKYDFRAMWKQFSLIWGATLALALANRWTNSIRFVIFYDPNNTMGSFASVALLVVFVSMFVISIIFVINRFSKGLLGSEGYLMHTLPVRPWQLVASKLICGTVVWLGSGIVAFLTPFLMTSMDWSELFEFSLWKNLFLGIAKHPDVPVLILEFCLMVLSVIIQSIAVIYLAISIGHLFVRHRRLISVASFIGLYVLLVNVYDRVFSARLTQRLMDVTTSNIYGSLLTAVAIMLIPATVFLAAVCWILENKLNLE